MIEEEDIMFDLKIKKIAYNEDEKIDRIKSLNKNYTFLSGFSQNQEITFQKNSDFKYETVER